MPNCDTVLKPKSEVLKTDPNTSADARFLSLESEIKEIKTFLFDFKSKKESQFKKENKNNGPGRIRTGDLRRVKATS